ncbi:Hint domain-containing protein, partial [Paracoccus sp. S1E-3]|uniref:Hint domain-containing protein n=4 Tax=Paracoccus TaxID=265 RepID=UPI0015EF3BCB
TAGTDSLGGADSIDAGAGDDRVVAGAGNDTVIGGLGDDRLDGGAGSDQLFGGDGADSLFGNAGQDLLDGGAGADTLTGGEGFDTFIAGTGDTITDFNTGAGQNLTDGNQANNDFVDLSGYYNEANLAIINAAREAQGLPTYGNPLAWLRGDQTDGNGLNDISIANGFGSDFTMTINSGGGATPSANLTHDNTNVICFGADALIRTARGDVAAGDLVIGDLIETRDAGLQPIRWIGSRVLDAADLAARPKLCPVRIRRGALGAGLPEADLIVSPQHRMLVRSKIAARMFGATEVLVAARLLIEMEGIELASDLTGVTYVHFLLDAHQIVLANGSETESLYTGAEALKSVGAAARAEIFELFPELEAGCTHPAARQLVPGRMGRQLVHRHHRNGQPLVQ